MNRILRTSAAVAALIVVSVATSTAADPAPGYVDFGRIVPSTEGKFVEVNLSEGLLKFGSMFASKQEPRAADVLRQTRSYDILNISLEIARRSYGDLLD